MKQNTSYTFLNYLFSRAALMNIVLPLVLYYVGFYLFDIGVALILSAAWAVFLAIQVKNRQTTLSVALMILLSGACHYLFLQHPAWLPIQQEDVFLSITGSLTVVVVFLFYSLRGQPVIQKFAEQARPQLTELSIYGSPQYQRVWQEISLAWVIIYLFKAILIYLLYHFNNTSLSLILFIASWPLTISMIFFSVRWPRYRWHRHADKA